MLSLRIVGLFLFMAKYACQTCRHSYAGWCGLDEDREYPVRRCSDYDEYCGDDDDDDDDYDNEDEAECPNCGGDAYWTGDCYECDDCGYCFDWENGLLNSM